MDKENDNFIMFCNECDWRERTRGLPYSGCPFCGHVNIGYLADRDAKELHIWLSSDYPVYTLTTYNETLLETNKGTSIIHTTQIHFCNTHMFEKEYTIYVHDGGKKMAKLNLGTVECTPRYIRAGHDLERLLLAGEFEENKG